MGQIRPWRSIAVSAAYRRVGEAVAPPRPPTDPDAQISRIKCGAPHLMRNVAPVDM